MQLDFKIFFGGKHLFHADFKYYVWFSKRGKAPTWVRNKIFKVREESMV